MSDTHKAMKDDAEQQRAIAMCLDMSKRMVAISGQAGSGKTSIIRIIYNKLVEQGIPVILAAPTGKAARRITEATGIKAYTIHKMLEFPRPGEFDDDGKPLEATRPKKTYDNPLHFVVVIVDEYAMVPWQLHNDIVAALPRGGRLCAFGDIGQLPPIENSSSFGIKKNGEVGTPFKKLLSSTSTNISGVELLTDWRTGDGSNVHSAAVRVRKGYAPPINQRMNDFYIKLTDSPVELMKGYILDPLDQEADFSTIRSQIISPQRTSWIGTTKLNILVQTLLNPNPAMTIIPDRHKWDKELITFGVGDKVVCTENIYDLRSYFERYYDWTIDGRPVAETFIPCPDNKQMMNGEIGIIKHIYPDNAIDVDFGDRIVEIPGEHEEYSIKHKSVFIVRPIKSISLAYVLTTHKCQGSEFDHVCYIINKSTFYMNCRQNLYTALTRARKTAMIFSDQASIRRSISVVKE